MRLEKIDHEINAHRFYEVYVTRDLLDEASLVVRWGRIGRPGRVRVHAGGEASYIDRVAEDLRSKKIRSGYLSKSQ